MMGQRRRLWPIIKTAFVKCFEFYEKVKKSSKMTQSDSMLGQRTKKGPYFCTSYDLS